MLEEGKVGESERLLIQYANEQAGKSSQAWVNIGNIAYLNNTQEALDAYQKAVQINPENTEAQNQLGHIYSRKGDLAAAEKAYQKILTLSGGDQSIKAVAYGNMGNVYQARGDLDKALELYQKSLAINETLGLKEGMAIDCSNMGIVYQVRGEECMALEIWKKSSLLFGQIGTKHMQKIVDDWIHELENDG